MKRSRDRDGEGDGVGDGSGRGFQPSFVRARTSTEQDSVIKQLKESISELFEEDKPDEVLSLCEKVKRRLNDSANYKNFLKSLKFYKEDFISQSELEILMEDLLGNYPDLKSEVNGFIHVPISGLDFSDCQKCSPSYWHLPEDYPLPRVSERNEVGDEVLNDHWVSRCEDPTSFKHRAKNKHEMALFKCEDKRDELDRLIGVTKAAAKSVKDLLQKCSKTDLKIVLEEHLSVLDISCIQHLYGRREGLKVLENLKKNPSPAVLTKLLEHLNQNLEERERERNELKERWAKVYVTNHEKSLDHRS